MLPVIEIPLMQQSQCQYHNNFFCHVVYERIEEHAGSKVFHLSETSVCGHFLTFQVSCAKIVYCIAAVRVVVLWMIFALITLFFFNRIITYWISMALFSACKYWWCFCFLRKMWCTLFILFDLGTNNLKIASCSAFAINVENFLISA